MAKIKRVLISVSDKTGLIDFARELSKLGIEIIATSGTLKFLEKGGINFVQSVSDVTNFPEILDGRVKTVHPKLIGGILALRNKKEHMNELRQHGITPIDMVVCNFYPFEKTISQRGNLEALLEQIDIGGPNLIRAAAKNFENVVVVSNPNRYDQVLDELKKKGDVSIQTRFILAKEAFKETTRYDKVIHKALESACV